MKYYIIFGPPGAGKGTQSVLLAEKYTLTHISTGELLRKEIESRSELGLKVKAIIENGKLVDDDTILELLNRVISGTQNGNKGYILDGYPRTIPQAEALDTILAAKGEKIAAVISLEIDEEVIFQRIALRAQLEERKDDMDRATIENRIAQYHRKTEPLIAYYKERGKYFQVNGNKKIDDNFKDICDILDKIK
ncbi:adenylate kinase [bioreactor metagenome]|uniref:Adenylate kinase n=1 Tax=bioreactor metagenome TaxID=1076179 RepID=A0A645EEG9_9ZZZZ|nr:adenylate kinase [Rikenellaceae bacterium]